MSETGILSDYLDRAQLAKELDCAERTLARYESEPDGLPSVMIAGKRYYKKASVLAFIESRTRTPNQRRAA